MSWEMVVGLEVHVELKTRTKIFCACPTAYGAVPNTQCCPVCLGYPGALPALNGEVIRLAVLAGLALGCKVHPVSGHDRKHYFYPDLPKAYQISQFDRPLCTGGGLDIGGKRIGITRIHIEEDAGKLIHGDGGTLIDCNRCGVPLIEIVSEPDIRTSQEAVAYLKKLRAILVCAGVSDCRMNEGSLRCDVNLSVHRPGEPFGTRTEMKNLNSFQAVQRAIEVEYRRQAEALEAGKIIAQETRRFDAAKGQTVLMRRKENADDYRYFPEPDMPDVVIDPAQIEAWRRSLPELPDARSLRYQRDYGLTAYAANQLAGNNALAADFDAAARATAAVKTLVSLMQTEVFRLLPDDESSIPMAPAHLARIAELAETGVINLGAAKKLIAALWEQDEDPDDYVARHGLRQITDEAELIRLAQTAIDRNPGMVAGYRKGKTNLKQALMGAAMGLSGGRADPVRLRGIVEGLLDENEGATT